MTPAAILSELERLRVTLIADGDCLRFRPRSAVSPALAAELAAHKGELMRMLVEVGAGGEIEPAQIEDNRDELPADDFPGDFTEDGWPANTAEQLPPCAKCGSLDRWWNLRGESRCMKCHPMTTALRILETAARLRERDAAKEQRRRDRTRRT